MALSAIQLHLVVCHPLVQVTAFLENKCSNNASVGQQSCCPCQSSIYSFSESTTLSSSLHIDQFCQRRFLARSSRVHLLVIYLRSKIISVIIHQLYMRYGGTVKIYSVRLLPPQICEFSNVLEPCQRVSLILFSSPGFGACPHINATLLCHCKIIAKHEGIMIDICALITRNSSLHHGTSTHFEVSTSLVPCHGHSRDFNNLLCSPPLKHTALKRSSLSLRLLPATSLPYPLLPARDRNKSHGGASPGFGRPSVKSTTTKPICREVNGER